MSKGKFVMAAIAIWAVFQVSFTGALVHLERQDGFCIACHLHEQKDRDMHAPAREIGQLTALHFEKGVGCADCHREPGPLGRVMTLYTLGVRDAASYLFTDFREPERLTTHIKNGTCIECHAETLARDGNPDSYHGTRVHNDRQDIRCTTCHLHHRPGDPEFAFIELTAFEAGCASCHRGLFPDAIPAQRLAPATGELSEMRSRLQEKGVYIERGQAIRPPARGAAD